MARARYFNAPLFYQAIDRQRRGRGIPWKEVASEAGISASSLSRIARGRRPDVDTLSALCAWADLDVNQFVNGGRSPRSNAPTAIAAYLSQDPFLTKDAASAIADLVAVAYTNLARPAARRSTTSQRAAHK